jgi:MFS family permease
LWTLVFAGPALRTSLLGGLLVAEKEIGESFSLGAGTLAILIESAICGGLLAVFLVSPLIAFAGIRRVSLVAAGLTVLCLAAALIAAPFMASGLRATVILFVAAILLGFLVAVLSPIAQTLLNQATTTDSPSRHALQSVWSAGQPAGFIVAALAGGILVERFGWWSALAVPLAFALVSALALLDGRIAHWHGREHPDNRPAIREIAWIVLALLAFEIWSTWGSLKSWAEPGVLAALMVTVAVSMMAINRLRRSSCPCVPLTPFSIAGFAAATFILFVYQFPTTAEFEVLLLGELKQMSASGIGSRTAIGNASQVAGTALAAVLLLQHRIRLALAAGFALTIVGLAGYCLYFWWSGFAFAATTRAMAGFGGGLLTPVLFVIALNRMPAALQVAAGTWLVLGVIGGTEVGLAMFDIVLDLTTALTGSAMRGYLSVEIAQLVLATATAAFTVSLAKRGSLPLTIGTVAVVPPTAAKIRET